MKKKPLTNFNNVYEYKKIAEQSRKLVEETENKSTKINFFFNNDHQQNF